MFLKVIIEMTLSSKRLRASLLEAMIGLFPCVNSKMSFEVTFLIKRFFAADDRTLEFPLPIMSFYMNFKSLFSRIRLVTPRISTFERFVCLVSVHMIDQVALGHK